LCSTVRELVYAISAYPKRQFYFAEVGKILSGVRDSSQIIMDEGYLNVYLETRVVYRAPSSSEIAKICGYLPSIQLGTSLYFYSREVKPAVHVFKLQTSVSHVQGHVYCLETLGNRVYSLRLNAGCRLYLESDDIKSSCEFNGSYQHVVRVLRSFFGTGIDPDLQSELFHLAFGLHHPQDPEWQKLTQFQTALIRCTTSDQWRIALNNA